jgi:hypothetical protein
MNKKKEVVLNRKVLSRLFLSTVLAFVTIIGIHHTGDFTVVKRSDTYKPEYRFNSMGESWHVTRSWSNEDKQQRVIVGSKAINSYSSEYLWESVNTPSYIEKLLYFYIPITFSYWPILIAVAAYYGIITFFTLYRLNVK